DRLRNEAADRALLKRGKELDRERFMLELVNRDSVDLKKNLTDVQEQAAYRGLTEWFRSDRGIRLLSIGVIDEHRRRAFVDAGNEIGCEREVRAAGFLDPSYPGMVHFLVDARYLAGEVEIRQFISRVCGKVRYRPDELIIGAGRLVESIADIRQCFHSSLIAFANAEVKPGMQVVVSYNVENLGKEPAGLEQKLLAMFEKGEETPFRDVLSQWLEESGNTYATVLLANRILLAFELTIRKHGGKPELLEVMWECQHSIRHLDGTASIRDKLVVLGLSVMRSVRAGRSMTTGEEIAREVKSYMDENLEQELNLADISKQFHINPSHLSEVFKKIVGKTFTDYLTEIRLKRAEALLSDPILKLTDIAFMSGFSNISYFSTVFKKHYGEPPTEYRFKMIGLPDKNRSD
ncbi:MAG: two-component system response regulator, partial [Paenibacillus sp.]|nr:two-component system response regulator [Paenibacillus sp.]